MLAFIVGLQAEARLGAEPAYVGGGTASGAARASAAAMQAGATALVSFGLAGGLSPAMRPGTLAVPREVLSGQRRFAADAALGAALGGFTCATLLAGDAILSRAAEKSCAWRDSGAEAVDLESGAVAEAAAAAGVPFAVLRAICDPSWRDLPPAAVLALDGAGAVGLASVLRSLARQPGQIGSLLTLAADAWQARRALMRRMATLRARGALRAWD